MSEYIFIYWTYTSINELLQGTHNEELWFFCFDQIESMLKKFIIIRRAIKIKKVKILQSVRATVPEVKTRRLTLKYQNTPFSGPARKMDDSILFPMQSSYIFW